MYMYLIYGLIIILFLVIVYGAWSRKRVYKLVDDLESKKIQLMNKPMTEELSKIKGLKMSGETEERFEHWRNGWDEIVTMQLPDIEEKIFDIEDYANKYRFSKANRIGKIVEDELSRIEDHLNEIIDEVDQLVQSEEQNRAEIYEIKDYYQDTKKHLWAQRATIGGASSSLERSLKEIQLQFEGFEEKTVNGNYLQAREVLLDIKEQLVYLNEVIDKIPRYLLLIEKDIPKQIEDLEKGLQELEEDGYVLDLFNFNWQISDMKQRLVALIQLVENLKLNDALQPIEKIQNEIEEIYEKLEHEVICRQKVEKALPKIQERIERLPAHFEKLRKDTEVVKLSYRLSEEEDRKQWKIEKRLKDLLSQFKVIIDAVEEKKQSFTSLQKIVTAFVEEMDQIEEDIHKGKERLDLLRRDERTADETIHELREKLLYGHKKLKKSNLPGVPETLLIELDEAEKALYKATEKLNELPLSIDEVMLKVDEAKEHVNRCVNKLSNVIEDASLAERVIQYGNRYRREYDDINIKLLQAEDYFRHYEYEEALEIALAAINPIDPNVLEKVSTNYSIQSF